MTPTATDTRSDTPTGTPTPTATPSFTDSDTPTTTPTDTPSYTATPSSTASDTPTITSTDTPSHTATPSFTASDTPTITSTCTVTPTWTDTYTFTPSPTITPTPLPASSSLLIAVYNSAGELVKSVFDGSAEYVPVNLNLSTTVIECGIPGAGVFISIPGYLIQAGGVQVGGLTWGADNNNGQPVESGIYTIVATVTNAFGQVSTLTRAVQVICAQPDNSLMIYNSAGEIVAHLALPMSVSVGIVSIAMPSTTYAPKISAVTGKATQPLVISVTASTGPNPLPLDWYGTNDEGVPVASGAYIAQLVYYAPGGTKTIIDIHFSVISSALPGFSGVFAVPNPALHGAPIEIMYAPVPSAYGVKGMLYDLAGRLVREAGNNGPPPLVFDTKGLSAGVYIASLEMTADGSSDVGRHAVVKVAVVQ
jgi:hypothetical protein